VDRITDLSHHTWLRLLVSGLTFKFLVHFVLIFVTGERWGFRLSSVCGYPVFPALFVGKIVLSPMHVLDTFVKKSVGLGYIVSSRPASAS
jgi:hypothetical protein